MPIRWILISQVAAIIIGCFVLSKLDLTKPRDKFLTIVFMVTTFFFLYPVNMPLTYPEYLPYVSHLKTLPYGAVIDDGAESGSYQLFNQTVHGKPMVFGYTTRVPTSVDNKNFNIFAALKEGRFDQLCKDYKVRYLTNPIERPLPTTYPIIYNDGITLIYDFKNSDNC